MPSQTITQSSFTAGEIDPRLARRDDVKPFYISASRMLNFIPLPFGGWERRGGTRHGAWLRPVLNEVTYGAGDVVLSGMISGTASNLNDNNLATGLIFAAPALNAVPILIDLQSVRAVAALDVINLSCAAGGGVDQIEAQVSPDLVTWTPLHDRKDIGTTQRTRRFASEARGALPVRYVRLQIVGVAIAGTFALAGLRLWEESALSSPCKLMSFSPEEGVHYHLAVTVGNIDIFRNSVRVASVPVPYAAGQIAALTVAQDFDTFVIFHPDVVPFVLFRQGSDGEWDARDAAFSNVPTESFNGGAAEPIMSASRGWPSCGAFFQSRLVIAGLRSRAATLLISVLGSPYNFNTAGTLATDAIRADIDGDESESPRIVRVRGGRKLEIYATNAFYFLSNSVIAKGEAFGITQAHRTGAARGPRVVDLDGASLYVQAGGQVLRELVYDDAEQNYRANPISTLSSHLIKNPVDLAKRRSTSTTDADLIYMPLADGTVTALSTLRAQEVTGFAALDFGGRVSACSVSGDNQIALAVERGGSGRIEFCDDALLLDGAVTRTLAPASATVTGLSHLNGLSVYAIADGTPLGPFTVAAGAIALDRLATQVEVGVWTPGRFRMHRASGTGDAKIPQDAFIDVPVVTIQCDGCGPFRARVDGGEWQECWPEPLPLTLDKPLAERLFAGAVEIDGFLLDDSPSANGQLELEQILPARFRVLAVTRYVIF
jgi:hypothetical protein